ncbi:Citrate transporter [Moraxella caviae]|uniref:Citrate transporter n=2 Tax=Moraxella caviae TaxID=34060 RepID=A0A378R6X7_9GAMM|nr:Citrate transporter [Moraxella caviae]
MVLVPFVGALIAGFDLTQIKEFYLDGTTSVIQIVVMFIFAILFFGIMGDAGVFKPLIDGLIKLTRGNVISVAVGTVLISVVAQLDGAGATTFLLVVPALLPLYQRLKMNPYMLFLLLAASAGITNMLPWGGPLARVATVLGADVEVIYRPLIAVQVIGITLTIIMAVILGMREKRRIIAEHGALVVGGHGFGLDADDEEVSANRGKFWVNVAIFVAAMVVLFANLLPPAFVFMLGTAVALMVNYRTPKEQLACINANAGGAIMMATIILAAGVFLGTLKGSGMLDAISQDLVNVLPAALLPNLHYVTGFLGVPLELVLSTDAYYFGLFPVVEQITSDVGVDPAKSGYAVMIGSIVGTFVSPFSPALWMGLGLANLSMGKHIRYSFFWIWGLSLAIMLCTWAIGVI